MHAPRIMLIVCPIVMAAAGCARDRMVWRELAPIPDERGLAGALVGLSHGALIVAGGTNFPPPVWDTAKTWHDRIYVLPSPQGQWREAGRLPRHELVEVGAAVDHALFVNGDAGGGAIEFGEAFGDVEFVQGGLGAHDGGGVTGGDSAGFDGGGSAGTVEAVHVGFGGVARVGAFGGYFAFFFFVEFVPAQHDVSSPA